MNSVISELWHGNIIPQEDSRTNSPEMKELLSYMATIFTYAFKLGMRIAIESLQDK